MALTSITFLRVNIEQKKSQFKEQMETRKFILTYNVGQNCPYNALSQLVKSSRLDSLPYKYGLR